MRLTKIIELIKEERKIVDYDRLGNPIYETVKTYTPVKCEVEPFGSELSEKSYGVFVKATHRAFSEPNDLLQLDELVRYDSEIYEITKIVKYDKHYETMLNYIGGDTDE